MCFSSICFALIIKIVTKDDENFFTSTYSFSSYAKVKQTQTKPLPKKKYYEVQLHSQLFVAIKRMKNRMFSKYFPKVRRGFSCAEKHTKNCEFLRVPNFSKQFWVSLHKRFMILRAFVFLFISKF